MKVFFDHSIFTLQKFGGVSNYIVNLAENFSKNVDPSIISMFYKNDDPLNFFPNKRYGHYTEQAYKEIAAHIKKHLD